MFGFEGYYPKDGPRKGNREAQVDMVDELLQWAGVQSANKVRHTAALSSSTVSGSIGKIVVARVSLDLSSTLSTSQLLDSSTWHLHTSCHQGGDLVGLLPGGRCGLWHRGQ